MAQVLVLGGGFGGLAAAQELRRRLSADDEITVVAARDHFFVGFAKLWDLVGLRPLADGTLPLDRLERHGIRFVQAEITHIDAERKTVETTAGRLSGDALIIALGAGFRPQDTALLGKGAHNLYDAAALPAMRADLERLQEGRLLVSIPGGSYLCPPAPYEAALLLDDWLRARGRRDRVDVVVSTPQPLTLPVAGPDASRYLADRLEERDVTILTEHPLESVDHAAGTAHFGGGETLEWQLLLGIPAAAPPPVVAASALAGPSGWMEPDPRTFATNVECVYAVGDCTLVPTATAFLPKAGTFAEAAGKVAATNLAAEVRGGQSASYDGHGFCFLELPSRRVATVTGDFYADPRPDVQLTPPSRAAFLAKQRWEQDRLEGWLG